MCVCVCVCVPVCACDCVCVRVRVCACMYANLHKLPNKQVRTQVDPVCFHSCTWNYTSFYILMYLRTLCRYVLMYVYTYSCMNVN